MDSKSDKVSTSPLPQNQLQDQSSVIEQKELSPHDLSTIATLQTKMSGLNLDKERNDYGLDQITLGGLAKDYSGLSILGQCKFRLMYLNLESLSFPRLTDNKKCDFVKKHASSQTIYYYCWSYPDCPMSIILEFRDGVKVNLHQLVNNLVLFQIR
jgi:hypothetical protein